MPIEAGLPSTPCLDRPYSSNTKGGTLIAKEITDVPSQLQALAEPDRVRPGQCSTCGGARMHVHDRRGRTLRGHRGVPTIAILLFRCARRQCRAVWRVLPQFLARHLWRTWSTVDEALRPSESSDERVPKRTRTRWSTRLRERAAVLVAVLDHGAERLLVELAVALGSGALRRDVVDAFGGLAKLSRLAALIHRLVPGVRVM